jgi:hypothetical protein
LGEQYSFLPHKPELQQDIDRWFLVLNCIFLFASAAIPTHQALQTVCLTHRHLY